jgi:dihydroceramide fatty acyl 2-hydroxylase
MKNLAFSGRPGQRHCGLLNFPRLFINLPSPHTTFASRHLRTETSFGYAAATMKDFVRNQRGRMFESNFFEFFSKVHPAMPFVFWVPIAVATMAWGLTEGVTTGLKSLGLVPLGWLTWQFLEYFIHKKVFHWEGVGPISRRFHDIVHGFHHKYPDDDTRLVMPLPVSIGLAAVIWAMLWPLGRLDLTLPYFIGILGGYLWYDFLHWSTHHRKPLTAWGAKLRQHHIAHHFAAGGYEKHFGISYMWLDIVLGSMLKRETSPEKT